jgi:hypothetical protein
MTENTELMSLNNFVKLSKKFGLNVEKADLEMIEHKKFLHLVGEVVMSINRIVKNITN